MHLPSWVSKQINPEQLQSLEQVIAQAEAKTQAEIVPMVVRSSTVTYKEFKYSYIFCFLAAFLTVNPLFFLVAYLLYNLHKKISRQAVLDRAIREFFALQVHQTSAQTGVLLFISLKEKQAVVLADKKISEFVDQSKWDQVIYSIQGHMKDKELSKALESSVTQIGDICAGICPPVKNDINELKNNLVVKE